MTRKERRDRKALLRRNLEDHLRLNANIELPEAHDPRFARTMVFTLSAVLVALILWAANTPVVEIATGQGVIETEVSVERVEHIDGGRIAAINISEGQRVSAGERLLSFETQTMEREVQKLDATLTALDAERARLVFVLEGAPIDPPPPLQSTDDPAATLFWTEQAFLEAQLDIILTERAAIEAALAVLQDQRQTFELETRLIVDRLARSRQALANGAIAKNEVERQERESLQAERSQLSLDAEIATQQSALTQSRLREVELEAQRKREAAQRLADLDSRRVSAALSRDELLDRINRASVTAGVGGIVMTLNAATPNEIIGPGELIAEIIPENSVLRAEVEMSADRIGNVEPGMEARIKVLTYDFTRFGQLLGTVSEVSPSSYQNERGETVFKVTVDLPSEQAEFTLGTKVLAPGLTVTVDVLSDTKMALSYLLKPLRLLRDRAFSEA